MHCGKSLLEKFLIIIGIVIGIGFRFIPNKLQLIIGIPLVVLLALYAFKAGESIYAKIIILLISLLGLSYLASISVKSQVVKNVIPLICGIIVLFIIVISIAHQKKIGVTKNAWNKIDIIVISIVLIMILVIVLEYIYT